MFSNAVFTIRQIRNASEDVFTGEISYLLRGKPQRTTVTGTRTKSGWFLLKSDDPKSEECFITLDGEQIDGLPPSKKQGVIVGGVSADEVLIDEKTKKIKTDKSQGASGAFRMLETSPNTWSLEIPEGKKFRLRPSPKPSLPLAGNRSSTTLSESTSSSESQSQSPSKVDSSSKPSQASEPINRITEVPLISSSSTQEELRYALYIAVDKKNWSSAIEIVDRMLKNAPPREAKELQEYRTQLKKRSSESSANP
ncbi:hypothetical protein ACKFKG_07435 [Phormidesmis sp. 146-35]